MASPRRDAKITDEQNNVLELHRIEPFAGGTSDSVVMVKLTDEVYEALVAAHRKRLKIQMKVDAQGGSWQIGGNESRPFRFNVHPLKTDEATDTVVSDPRTSIHRNVGAFRTKWQMQATDKSFSDTRDKTARQLDSQPRTKDANKHGKMKVMPGRVANSPLISSRLNDSNRNSPGKLSAGNGIHSSSAGVASASNARPLEALQGELRKKKLRQRIVQLIVTAKLRGTEEVLQRLRKDGITEERDLAKRVDEIIREVSEVNGSGDAIRYVLKAQFYSEVDTRWPWWSASEKEGVRKIIMGGNSGHTNSSTFAPPRKTGMMKMQAPSGHPASQTVSPEAIPTPPASRPPSGGSDHFGQVKEKESPKPKAPTPSMAMPRESPLLTPDNSSMDSVDMAGVKRKAHIPNPGSTSLPPTTTTTRDKKRSVVSGEREEKRRRRDESSSPPEDPSSHANINQKLLAARAGGSTASSLRSSPCSISSPTQPAEWEKHFPEIKVTGDADRYYSAFIADYPEYTECYKYLNEVAQEFRQYESKLRQTQQREQTSKIERLIQQRFVHYEKHADYKKFKQRYSELRVKLAVLKHRIEEWERCRGSTASVNMDIC